MTDKITFGKRVTVSEPVDRFLSSHLVLCEGFIAERKSLLGPWRICRDERSISAFTCTITADYSPEQIFVLCTALYQAMHHGFALHEIGVSLEQL